MTKAPTPAEMSKGQRDNIHNATKMLDYTAVADRIGRSSWSNYGHPTGFVNRFTGLLRHELSPWHELSPATIHADARSMNRRRRQFMP